MVVFTTTSEQESPSGLAVATLNKGGREGEGGGRKRELLHVCMYVCMNIVYTYSGQLAEYVIVTSGGASNDNATLDTAF